MLWIRIRSNFALADPSEMEWQKIPQTQYKLDIWFHLFKIFHLHETEVETLQFFPCKKLTVVIIYF